MPHIISSGHLLVRLRQCWKELMGHSNNEDNKEEDGGKEKKDEGLESLERGVRDGESKVLPRIFEEEIFDSLGEAVEDAIAPAPSKQDDDS